METMRFKIIVIVILVLALLGVLRFVQRKELQLKYSLVWLIVDVLMILVVVIPNALTNLASLMGVYSVANMLFFIGILFVLAICFSLTVALSRASDRIRQLSQKLGLYENEARNREAKVGGESGNE